MLQILEGMALLPSWVCLNYDCQFLPIDLHALRVVKISSTVLNTLSFEINFCVFPASANVFLLHENGCVLLS